MNDVCEGFCQSSIVLAVEPTVSYEKTHSANLNTTLLENLESRLGAPRYCTNSFADGSFSCSNKCAARSTRRPAPSRAVQHNASMLLTST